MVLDAFGWLVGAVLWLGEFCVRSGFGWRFILSPRYRADTVARWQEDGGLYSSVEIFGAATGMCITVLLLAWAISTAI
ncbi:MAG: hypothetical protein H7Z74_00305 [Anaerolineae bacterium]|nr:hypothetical protein [Gemmatimonadaceae bacterium]